MQPTTLIKIKKEVKKLLPLLEAYIKTTFDNNLLVAMKVQLSNFCFKWDDCVGYTFEKDLEKCEDIYNFFQELKQFESDYHFVVYIIEQFTMIYDGNYMSEGYSHDEIYSN